MSEGTPRGFICSLGAFFLVWIVLYTGCRCSTCYARILRRVMVWAAMAVVASREVAAPAFSTPVWTSCGVSVVAVASSRRASCLGVSCVVSFLGVGHLRLVSSCLVRSSRLCVSCCSSRSGAVCGGEALLACHAVSSECYSHCHLSYLWRLVVVIIV